MSSMYKNLVNFDFTPENTKKDGTEKFSENYLSDSDLEKALHIIDRKLWSKNQVK